MIWLQARLEESIRKTIVSLSADINTALGEEKLNLLLSDLDSLLEIFSQKEKTPMTTDSVAVLKSIANAHEYFAANGDLRMSTGDHERQAKRLRAVIAALTPSAPAAKKPAECANGCPPFQVCDYCQGVGGQDSTPPLTPAADIEQALTDPENQPSQWGTIPLSMLPPRKDDSRDWGIEADYDDGKAAGWNECLDAIATPPLAGQREDADWNTLKKWADANGYGGSTDSEARAAQAETELAELRARLVELQAFAGSLAVYVQGHFAFPTANSESVCQTWATSVQDMNAKLDALLYHNEFSHDFIKDEKACAECKRNKAVDALLSEPSAPKEVKR